jgi:phytoene dehydrogenase-like protein
MNRHDVVVVGGGHNGLVAACFLARAGLDVAVVEQRDWLGGMATTMPLVDSAPEHLLSPGAYENVYLRAAGVADELELARFGYRELDAAGWAWLGPDGESLLFHRSVEETIREIARFSRADAGRYRELVDAGVRILAIQDRYQGRHPKRPGVATIAVAVRALATDRRVRALLAATLTTTAADAISSMFESEPVRGAFVSAGTILLPPTIDGSAIGLLASSLLHHKGAARPVGGMGGLVAALERCLTAHGGHVRTGSAAVAIHARAGRADAVELADGTVLQASRAVLAACPPQLVPALVGGALEPTIAGRLNAAPANAAGVGCLTVSVALRGRLELPFHQPGRPGFDLRRPTLFRGRFEDVVRASEQAARGDVPDVTTWCVAIFSAIDPSQAPPGQDVAQLYAPTPVSPRLGRDAHRETGAARLVASVAEVAPALPQLELGRYIETPADLAVRTGATNGCIYHVDHLPTRMAALRPALGAGGYRTPLAGLYLGSAGCHPGGGVSGLPGKLSAATVLRDLRGRAYATNRTITAPRATVTSAASALPTDDQRELSAIETGPATATAAAPTTSVGTNRR